MFLAAALALDVWMVINHRAAADALRSAGCAPTVHCAVPTGLFAPARQAVVIVVLLWLLPLALGSVLGVGLVAGETERTTHRLTWTQHISRTRWYLTSLAVAAVGCLVVVAVVLPVAHWWAGAAWVDLPDQLTLGGDRIQPDVFPLSGVVPLAYTCFAVALGTAAGALLRRVPWATAVTVVVYLAIAAVMVTTVRASFAPTGFFMDGTTDSAQYVSWPYPPPWNVGYEYRLIPGASVPATRMPPDRVAGACAYLGIHPQDVVTCMRKQGVEGGFVTQSPAHYWRLQRAEALLYAGLAVVLAGVGLVAVRRMQD